MTEHGFKSKEIPNELRHAVRNAIDGKHIEEIIDAFIMKESIKKAKNKKATANEEKISISNIFKELELEENLKEKQKFRKYIISNKNFNFDIYEKYYNNKKALIPIIEKKDLIQVDDIVINNKYDVYCLLCILGNIFESFKIIKSIWKYYLKKRQKMNIINYDLNKTSDFKLLKKSLGCIFFKNRLVEDFYSIYKLYHKFIQVTKEKLNANNNFMNDENYCKIINIINEINTKEYNIDKKMSSGELKIYEFLLALYKENDSLIFLSYETTIDACYKNKLRADFFCIIIDNTNCIKKVIIEVNGEQHYKPNKFYGDFELITTRDNIKKKYCYDNNIIYYALNYNELDAFPSIFMQILYTNN